LGTKVELRLKKKVENKKWLGLEGEADSLPAPIAEEAESKKPKVPEELLKSTKPPSYPTSSKNGPVNWDKLELEDEDVDDEGDPVNALFKSIYKGADDDTKRAMMKSFVESNGTALSTNWEEVGKKKMQVTPPEGMEAKPYEI
jgi:suppressor of G2 allele of SKP1